MKLLYTLICTLYILNIFAQTPTDSLKVERFSIHAQTTVIHQYKPGFSAQYSGENSLETHEEHATSLTSTLYMGVKLWKGGSFFVNPEIAGGSGFSKTLGIAAAPNGETFRIGSPAPNIYIARAFYHQIFGLGKDLQSSKDEFFHNHSDFNQLANFEPKRHIALTIGKVSIADYFDDNKYSHDPRTQFMSWGLMSNGAWDYPANTRGYTPSMVLEYISPTHELRYGFSLIPLVANGPVMNLEFSKANSNTIEYVHHHTLKNRKGAVRILGFYTIGQMGNYQQSLSLSSIYPSIESTRLYGRNKFGIGINIEQEITSNLGGFVRASWNDGKNETWAFTEIDHSLSAGLQLNGTTWKRENDYVGIAYVISGISKDHRNYLAAGGKGFMLGDGKLNYANEHLAELYYAARLRENIFLTGDYQMIVNPGYNSDRKGPIHVFSVRVHLRM